MLNSSRFQQYSRKIEASKAWLLCLVLLVLLCIWNRTLVLSGGMGLTAFVLVYLVQQGQWQLPQVNWQALWKPSNRALTLGLISGAIVCFSTYLTLAIWREAGGSWLAKGIILEGFGILAMGLLLLWQWIQRSLSHATSCDRSFDHGLNDLSHPDALKRLIAVRRLTQSILQHSAAASVDRPPSALPLSAAELADCFRLLLDRETEPIVCRALLSSLQMLKQPQTRSLQMGESLRFSAEVQTKASLKN